jgi:hypothetical protein
MTIAIREEPGQPPMTELTGSLPDQAMLLDVLNQLYLHLSSCSAWSVFPSETAP